jgi:hypothetical protein
MRTIFLFGTIILNLINCVQYTPEDLEILEIVRKNGFKIPMIGNENEFWIEESKKIERGRKNHIDLLSETNNS